MECDPNHPTQPRERKRSNPLKYTFDGQFLPTTPPDEDDADDDDDDTCRRLDSDARKSENGESSESGSDSTYPTAGLAASLQVIANTMLRMELAQLEMMKKREIDWIETQMRKARLEGEMIQMMLQTQSQIASFVRQSGPARKRKKADSG